jgi:hypothetical protein
MPRLILPSILIALAAGSAHAETVTRSLDGTQLALSVNCLKAASIEPDPSLQGRIEIEAEAANHEELDPLEFTGGTTARIERKGECRGHWFDDQHGPTLTLRIKVPAATPIDLDDVGAGDYKIGAVGAPLKLDISGSGDIDAALATDLDLRIGGSGNLDLHRLDGHARIGIHGSGDVAIDTGTLRGLDLDLHGSGDVKIAEGNVGPLAATLTGSGDFELHRQDGPAKIEIRGNGDVAIESGKLPSLAINLSGSGDAKLHDVTVEALTASASGSGTISIGGTVTNATLSSAGSSDIQIAKLTGSVQTSKTGSGEISIGR